MKAKKSSPKSIRFNIIDFDAAMLKGSFESAQEMVDFLLKDYIKNESVKLNALKNEQKIEHQKQNVPVQKELSKGEIFRLIREGKI